MTLPTRPNLSGLPDDVIAYIQALEAALASGVRKRESTPAEDDNLADLPPLETSEQPTTLNLVTLSRNGQIKRALRHLYLRQRRSGMGATDLDLMDGDAPAALAVVEADQRLLILTNHGKAYHLPANKIEEGELRGSGQGIRDKLGWTDGELAIAMLPNPVQGYLLLVSERGFVRRLRHHVFGEYMKPGTQVMDVRKTGILAAATLSTREADTLIATRKGLAIRFAEKQIAAEGVSGMRIAEDDAAIAICAVDDESGVFFLTDEGRGTIRLMSGFSANKAPGSGGKQAIKADVVVDAVSVRPDQDLFLYSESGKLIRFRAGEVPPKEGVVQGVICMGLRGDICTLAFANG